MLVNILGSFAMGLLIAWLARRSAGDLDLRLLAGDRVSGRFHHFFGVFTGCCDALRARCVDGGCWLCDCQRCSVHPRIVCPLAGAPALFGGLTNMAGAPVL
jgi:hypothetical protein